MTANVGQMTLETSMGYNFALLNPKSRENIASLLRSGQNFGLNTLFIIGGYVSEKHHGNVHKFSHQMNTQNGIHRINLQYFDTLSDFLRHLPAQTTLVVVEMKDTATELARFAHPLNATYLLGRETVGITDSHMCEIRQFFDTLNTGIPDQFLATHPKMARLDFVKISTPESLNTAVCGALVMYDRFAKSNTSALPNHGVQGTPASAGAPDA